MNWVEGTLAEFGRQIGLAEFSAGERGVMHLELQAGGFLSIDAGSQAQEVLVCLGRPVGFSASQVVRRALELAHFDSAFPLPVQVGVRGDGPDALLLMVARLPEREFTPQGLNRTIEFLDRWSDGARDE